MPEYLSDPPLHRSPVVANSAMNRERGLSGANSYSRDLHLDLWRLLRAGLNAGRSFRWLDLCCGTGRALVEAGRRLQDAGLAPRAAVLGVDLVPMFAPVPPDLDCVRLTAGALPDWSPDGAFDLITCVHGLHYLGDKLAMVERAVSWLAEDGLFVAHLDLANLRFAGGAPAGREIVRALRRHGIEYGGRKRLLSCRGKREIRLPFRYLGADDQAGPNFTGQPAVDSYYVRLSMSTGGESCELTENEVP
jgi:SAM-dependent methyltransferase